MIKLQDFARDCGVTDRAIQKHLKTYAAELEGLYQRKGPNGTWLTDEACEILRSKMKQAPPAVFEPDPRVGQLQEQLDETKAVAKELWEQMKQKEKSMALLIEQNNELRLQAASMARLEADNKVAKQNALEAAEAAQKAREELLKAQERNRILEEYTAACREYNELPAWRRMITKPPTAPDLQEE